MSKRISVFTAFSLLFLTQVASAFYDANIGRWLNRDPLEDQGFRVRSVLGRMPFGEGNLFVFVANDPVNKIDAFGLKIINPLSYGNWCGYSKQGQGGPPIDDVDAACENHDYCLATPGDFFNPCNQVACNIEFCNQVADADCSTSPNPSACKQEKSWIGGVCAAVLFGFGGGAPWWYPWL